MNKKLEKKSWRTVIFGPFEKAGAFYMSWQLTEPAGLCRIAGKEPMVVEKRRLLAARKVELNIKEVMRFRGAVNSARILLFGEVCLRMGWSVGDLIAGGIDLEAVEFAAEVETDDISDV